MTVTPSNLPEPVSIGLRSLIPGIVRTFIPLVVAGAVRIGLTETSLDMRWIEWVLTGLVTMAYYVVVRVAERHWDKIGWLLGYPAQPVYVKGEVIAVTDVPTPPTTTTVIETDASSTPVDSPVDDASGEHRADTP